MHVHIWKRSLDFQHNLSWFTLKNIIVWNDLFPRKLLILKLEITIEARVTMKAINKCGIWLGQGSSNLEPKASNTANTNAMTPFLTDTIYYLFSSNTFCLILFLSGKKKKKKSECLTHDHCSWNLFSTLVSVWIHCCSLIGSRLSHCVHHMQFSATVQREDDGCRWLQGHWPIFTASVYS